MKLSKAFQGRQKPDIVRAFNDNLDSSTEEPQPQPPVSDAELLDAYSQTVAGQNVPVHPRVARYHRLPVSHGVLIVGIEPESPAARAGLREGDILVAFKREPVASIDHLQRSLVAAEIGVTSPLTVVRHTEKLELFVTPEEWEPDIYRN